MKKYILFITTTNLTTNPRIAKEMKLALQKGYRVSFVGFDLGGWSAKVEPENQKDYKGVDFTYLSAKRKPFFQWFFIGIAHLFAEKLGFLFQKNLFFASFIHNKRTLQLLFALNKKNTCDLIVAHNLGALYPAYWFAKRHKIPFAFDVEDYHQGETINHQNAANEIKRRDFLLETLLPKTTYTTFAAPLIQEYTLQNTKNKKQEKYFTVLNSFANDDFLPTFDTSKSETLHLVWYSQNIGFGRGLELIIAVLPYFENKIHLTLIGNMESKFYEKEIKPYQQYMTILQPLSQKALHQTIGKYDIGLALELTTTDFNRAICLTNKMIAYCQSGLYVLASNTQGQQDFMKKYDLAGIITEQNPESIKENLNFLIKEKENIHFNKEHRRLFFQTICFEKESEKIHYQWNLIFTP